MAAVATQHGLPLFVDAAAELAVGETVPFCCTPLSLK